MNDRAALLAKALSAHRAGDLATAEPVYARLLEIDPDDAEVLHLSAVIYLQKGRALEALPLAQASTVIDSAQAKPWNTLGSCLAALGRQDEAIAAFRKAIAIDADFTPGRANLANLLNQTGASAEAEEQLRRIIASNPQDAAAHNNLGSALHAQGRGDEAEAEFREALRLAPTLPEARLNLGIRARENGNADEARTLLASLTHSGGKLLHDTILPAIIPDAASIDSLRQRYERGLDSLMERPGSISDPLVEIGQLPQFYLGYHSRDDRPLQEKLARALRLACPSLDFTAPHCRPGQWRPGKRLRVGVVSRHLYNHTIGKLMEGLLRGLSGPDAQTFVFFLGGRDDAVTARISAQADHAAQLPSVLPLARAMLAEAKLDVLLYPDIGMEPLTYFLAHARLAPVQITTWGHPVTTGLPHVDIFLSAEAMDPPGSEAHYSEKLLRLPHPALCYARPQAVTPMDRAALGLPATGRLVVCPQTLFKFHPDFDRLIGGVLRSRSDARLVLIEGKDLWRRQLEQRFRASIPDVAERIVFVPRLSQHDFIALIAAADLMIDIPQWAGGNTTLEALSSDTPIVTLPSPFMRGQLTAAMLLRAGLDDLVAKDEDQYVAKAAAILDDPAPWRILVRRHSDALYGEQGDAARLSAVFRSQVEEARK
ncbi:MAG: tetratricopeptide repeat protein [Magnetospirillum sp.]|nr:tetratricopeptide repeat protein [Magnetospirillum sp.]